MEIVDYFNDYEQYYNIDATIDELYSQWNLYMSDKEELKKICIKEYTDIGLNLDNLVRNRVFCFTHDNYQKMQVTYNNLRQITMKILNIINKKYPIKQVDMNIVFYHGLANGAGWVTTFQGKRSILLGIEKIAELNWHNYSQLEALVSHEMAHIIHFEIRRCLEEFDDLYKQGIILIYQEGFAQYYQSNLLEKKVESRGKEWECRCFERISELKKLYKLALKDIKKGCSDFFGDWNEVLGLSDVGYYLGEVFIKELTNIYTMREIALLSFNSIEEKVLNFLNT